MFALRWRSIALVAFGWFVLFVLALSFEATAEIAPAAEILANATALPTVARSYSLAVLLLLLSLIWLAAAVVLRGALADDALALSAPSLGAGLILVGGLVLSLELTARLLAARHFDGRASAFAFGLKCETGVEPCALEVNAAFAPEFNSVGHCVQGCLSLFLFPGWTRLLARPRASAQLLLKGFGAVTTAYPIYNAIKRTGIHGADFAASSFANNSAEWAIGFHLGLGLCLALTAAAHRWAAPAPPEEAAAVVFPTVSRYVWWMSVAAGAALCACAIMAAVLFGATWDVTPVAVHSDDLDVTALVLMLLIVVIFAIGALAVVCKERRRRDQSRRPAARPAPTRLAPVEEPKPQDTTSRNSSTFREDEGSIRPGELGKQLSGRV